MRCFFPSNLIFTKRTEEKPYWTNCTVCFGGQSLSSNFIVMHSFGYHFRRLQSAPFVRQITKLTFSLMILYWYRISELPSSSTYNTSWWILACLEVIGATNMIFSFNLNCKKALSAHWVTVNRGCDSFRITAYSNKRRCLYVNRGKQGIGPSVLRRTMEPREFRAPR